MQAKTYKIPLQASLLRTLSLFCSPYTLEMVHRKTLAGKVKSRWLSINRG